MNEDRVLEVLKQKLEADIDVRVIALRSGQPNDYSEYRHTCGQIRGLEAACDHIDSLLQHLRDDDE